MRLHNEPPLKLAAAMSVQLLALRVMRRLPALTLLAKPYPPLKH
jgi:hypothetical protein